MRVTDIRTRVVEWRGRWPSHIRCPSCLTPAGLTIKEDALKGFDVIK